MALPYLPGNVFNKNLGKTKFHKSHHFDYSNDVSMMVGATKPGIGGDPLSCQEKLENHSGIPRGKGTDQPAWVAFDRQVLCFDAYFQEAVNEKREEQYRIRSCKIYFYLEDDSVQVIEPRAKNAGIPQGTLIRRHRIPRPPPNDNEFYTVEDFNVGREVMLYSKKFKLIGCDQFTQNFLGKLGVRVPPSEAQIPDDPYMNHRKALDESMQPLRPYEKHDTLRQFLNHDRHVLRFYCWWDDQDSMFGDCREMVLHYFLADDTIEIRECIPANSGRDAAPMFLRRGKLPKDVASLPQPGVATDRTVLNVFGPTGHGGRYILDSLKTGAVHVECYKDCDLQIGAYINVWGRKFLLVDSDDFTKHYYKTKYNVEMQAVNLDKFPNLKLQRSIDHQREMPPYNGFGSEEDSLCSCMGLLPKPPKRDFIKFMEKDRHGLDSNVLRFLGRIDTTKPIDAERRFIISYFLSDDTILVFEPPVRNSGVIGGKFLERGRVKKPNQPRFSTKPSEYYHAQDLYVGACAEINCHKFILIDADEYAFNYMERHCNNFEKADIGRVIPKLHASLASPEDLGNDCMSVEVFQKRISDLVGNKLSGHEIITIARFYQDRQNEQPLTPEQFSAVAQDQLKKKNFENFSGIVDQCEHHDHERVGALSADTIRSVFQALKVPVQGDLLRASLDSMANEAGLVDYKLLVHRMNWRDNAAAPMPVEPSSSTFERGEAQQLQRVNVSQLVQDLQGASNAP